MAAPTPSAPAPVKGGWIWKQKKIGWKKLWAIMYGAKMTCFDSPEKIPFEEGVIEIVGTTVLPMKADAAKNKWKFSIASQKKQIILYAATELERNQWVNGLRLIAEGKFINDQLMEKPALASGKTGELLSEDEAKKIAKKGFVPDGVTVAPPVPAGFTRTPQGLQPVIGKNSYQIEELISPTPPTSSVMGKKLKWEQEEKARDLFACNMGKERNTFGGAEVDDGENDWLEEKEGDGPSPGGCTQQ